MFMNDLGRLRHMLDAADETRLFIENKPEFWILSSVVEAWYPLDWLAAQNIGVLYNRSGHGLSSRLLGETLDRLFQTGVLLARRIEGQNPAADFVPTSGEIQAALSGELRAYYGLSEQGGLLWETYANPDWDRYIAVVYRTDPDEAELIASDSQLVQQYLHWQHHVWKVHVINGSEAWNILAPWQATYWKTLPKAHQLHFLYANEDLSDMNREATPKMVTDWFAYIHKWYTNPFEEQGK